MVSFKKLRDVILLLDTRSDMFGIENIKEYKVHIDSYHGDNEINHLVININYDTKEIYLTTGQSIQ